MYALSVEISETQIIWYEYHGVVIMTCALYAISGPHKNIVWVRDQWDAAQLEHQDPVVQNFGCFFVAGLDVIFCKQFCHPR